MTHTHERYAQHIDMVFYATNIRVKEVRHHTGQRGASNMTDNLAEYGGIRNRKPLLPMAATARWSRATHPSKARPRSREWVTGLKRGPLGYIRSLNADSSSCVTSDGVDQETCGVIFDVPPGLLYHPSKQLCSIRRNNYRFLEGHKRDNVLARNS